MRTVFDILNYQNLFPEKRAQLVCLTKVITWPQLVKAGQSYPSDKSLYSG